MQESGRLKKDVLFPAEKRAAPNISKELSDPHLYDFWTKYFSAAPESVSSVGVYSATNLLVGQPGFYHLDESLLKQEDLLPNYLLEYYRRGGKRAVRDATRRRRRLPGAHLVVLSDSYQVYGHWLLDMLPRLWLFQQCFGALDADTRILLPYDVPAYALDLLRTHFRLSDRSFAFFNPATEDVLLERALLPSMLHNHHFFHSAMNFFVRNAQALYAADMDRPTGKRLFISRQRLDSPSDRRRLVNLQDVLRLVEDKGFEIIFPEELSWPAQISAFSRAEMVVGEGGSGLHNTLFSPQGAIVLCIRPQNAVQPSICALREQKIGLVGGVNERVEEHEIRYEANIGQLETILDRAIALQQNGRPRAADKERGRQAETRLLYQRVARLEETVQNLSDRLAVARDAIACHELKASDASLEKLGVETESPLFDRAFYEAQRPELKATGVDAYLHYLCIGAAQGGDPNPMFDTDWYANHYPDVKASGINPLIHYVLYGAAEGRNPHPAFSTSAYLAQHPELEESGENPLLHYLRSRR